jgi:UDP-3-O-[3-hydroxymyristoyl] glucosamine N-acyltransferase
LSKQRSITLGDIVKRFGGELIGSSRIRITQVSTLASAGPTDIAFLAQRAYLPQLGNTRAAAVILAPDASSATGLPRIVSQNPYAYFARVSAFLNPPAVVRPGRHKSAIVDRTARLAKSACIAAGAVIGRDASIGARSVVGPGSYVGDHAKIGADTRINANVTIQVGCIVGARCTVHSGAVIGADGFGIAHDDGIWRKIPQIGKVLIGDDVEIGANTTIDRGALDDTIIEDGVKLDNQIQIAHNVRVGAHTAIAACVGIAGSARIGSHCMIGGAAMIIGHIDIADNVIVSAGTFVMKSIRKSGTYTGVYPFSEHPDWLRNAAHLRQLHKLVSRVRDLEQKLQAAEGNAS